MSYYYDPQPHNNDDDNDGDEEDDELQRALAMSLATASAASAAASAAATTTNKNTTTEQDHHHHHDNEEDDDDEDAQLARALAMSLEEAAAAAAAVSTAAHSSGAGEDTTKDNNMSVEEEDHHHSTVSTAGISSSPPPTVTATAATRRLSPIPPVDVTKLVVSSSSSQQQQQQQQQVYQWVQSARPTDIQAAHQVLWDPTVTVPNDQRRWVAQPILFQEEEEGSSTASNTSNTTPWGLVQAHGGPCGVLASLQAELLQCLFFGDDNHNNHNNHNNQKNDENHKGVASRLLARGAAAAAATDASTPTATGMTRPQSSSSSLKACLAFSMGVILARASLQPSAAEPTNDDDDEPTQDPSSSSWSSTAPLVCRLVFPVVHNSSDPTKDKVQTDWEDFAPWNTTTTTHTTTTTNDSTPILSEHLVTYTIAIDDDDDNDDNDETNTDMDENSNNDNDDTKSKTTNLHDHAPRRQEALARAVANFLLETNLLEWYARPGGVLLFVVALILSRSRARLISDMDDPTSTLTSQFGHSSQELINLLLTGQATSNVFDYTLQPSGDWICRGISQRPTIGYLTLLESLRYVQVGTFYKRPHTPIWVLGSTSHFTVLWGDSWAPLHESKSDSILQSVRRAFLQMDGAQDQGFIRTDQWPAFCHKVEGLYEALGHEEAAMQTLGATLEVHGAGILLWEDVWKRTSRLLTGASLQSVLLDTEDDRWNTGTNSQTLLPPPPHAGSSSVAATTGSYGPSATAAATGAVTGVASSTCEPPPLISFASDHSTTTANNKNNDDDEHNNMNNTMSDEDYARMLQAEWNDPGIGGNTTTTQEPTVSSAAQESSSSTKPAAIMPLKNHTNNNNNNRSETFGKTFRLYHYNGLRGGTLTTFQVTPLDSEEAIGASVPLEHKGTGDSDASSSSSSTGLPQVLRTKWPSCKLQWADGSTPPSID